MDSVKEKRLKEENEERTRLDLMYKEKIEKAEEEKLVQLDVVTKLE